jgi:hypothetical protein
MLSQSECDQIVQHFVSLPFSSRAKTNHFDFDLLDRPPLFIKYGDVDLLAEASTQSFFHALAQRDSSAPAIPAVYHAFPGDGCSFIIMERVGFPTVKSIEHDRAVKRVASAVKWLLAQASAVPDSVFGRISASEACVWHRFFKDHQAPVPFVNSDAVAKYVNEV